MEDAYALSNENTKRQMHYCYGGNNVAEMSPSLDTILAQPPLGLCLTITPSLIHLIEKELSQQHSPSTSCATNSLRRETGKGKDLKSTVKFKASQFAACHLKIGSWEFESRYRDDLVAKCYYGKHKLIWEILDGNLKRKIEIQWSDILAMKATYSDDMETLDITLARQPRFYIEVDPEPRKHTVWQRTSDFTNGQATISSRHFLKCLPGKLRNHFEMLIQSDSRLKSLSEQSENNEVSAAIVPIADVSTMGKTSLSSAIDPHSEKDYILMSDSMNLGGEDSIAMGNFMNDYILMSDSMNLGGEGSIAMGNFMNVRGEDCIATSNFMNLRGEGCVSMNGFMNLTEEGYISMSDFMNVRGEDCIAMSNFMNLGEEGCVSMNGFMNPTEEGYISMSDFMNLSGENCISVDPQYDINLSNDIQTIEELERYLMSNIDSYSCPIQQEDSVIDADGSPDNKFTSENVQQSLHKESELNLASDEQSLMPNVDSFGCLTVQQDSVVDVDKEDEFYELLMDMLRVPSPPKFLIDGSENAEAPDISYN